MSEMSIIMRCLECEEDGKDHQSCLMPFEWMLQHHVATGHDRFEKLSVLAYVGNWVSSKLKRKGGTSHE